MTHHKIHLSFESLCEKVQRFLEKIAIKVDFLKKSVNIVILIIFCYSSDNFFLLPQSGADTGELHPPDRFRDGRIFRKASH